MLKTFFYGLKSLGNLQSISRTALNDSGVTITGQKSNYSVVDKFEMRRQIKSNAYSLIKNMSSGDVFKGVKFIYGDFVINGDGTNGFGNQDGNNGYDNYDTLIIKNGNLFITGSGRVIDKNLGVIIMKDDLADKTIGNLYITPNVTYIKGVIYLDGSIISKPDVGFYSVDGTIGGRFFRFYGKN